MFYETHTHKSLIGFRLKLVFHSILNNDNTYVYVDVRECPTVGALLSRIAARFGILASLSASLHNLTVLTSENVLVLADVDEVKISVSDETLPVYRSAQPNLKSTYSSQENISNATRELSRTQNTAIVPSSIPPDSKQNNHEAVRPVCMNRSIARNEDAAAETMLLRQLPVSEREYECTASTSNVPESTRDELKQPVMTKPFVEKQEIEHENRETFTNELKKVPGAKFTKNYPGGLAGFISQLRDRQAGERKSVSRDSTTADEQNLNVSEVNDIGVDDSSEVSYDKKKRKRKRKHSKKPKEISVHVDEVDTSSQIFSNLNHVPRTHIRFDDVDGGSQKESPNETRILNEVAEATSPNSPDIKYRKKLFKEPETLEKTAYTVSETSVDSTNRVPHVGNFSSDILVQNVQDAARTPSFNTTRKPKLLGNYVENEKQLGTLLMCKELNTVCQYNVQFPNDRLPSARNEQNTPNTHSKRKFFTMLDSPINKVQHSSPRSVSHSVTSPRLPNVTTWQNLDVSVGESYSTVKCDSNTLDDETKFSDEFHSRTYIIDKRNSPSPVNSNCGREEQKPKIAENGHLAAGNDYPLDECEVLLHFRVENTEIHLRNVDGSWRILTAALAEADLPAVFVPKENQSIVFKILYLKQSMFPTETDFLILGRVLKFIPSTQEVALEIPVSFVNKLLDDSGEEATLPEGMKHITGSVYQLEWFAVRNPRLLT